MVCNFMSAIMWLHFFSILSEEKILGEPTLLYD